MVKINVSRLFSDNCLQTMSLSEYYQCHTQAKAAYSLKKNTQSKKENKKITNFNFTPLCTSSSFSNTDS